MATSNSICQSCGMPLKRDAQGGGTNVDGSRSEKYCSHCYQRGEFTAPNLDAAQMRTLVIGKLREFHFPGFLARFMTRNIDQLERWR
jgi:Putative zinc ribbon domain